MKRWDAARISKRCGVPVSVRWRSVRQYVLTIWKAVSPMRKRLRNFRLNQSIFCFRRVPAVMLDAALRPDGSPMASVCLS